ncbi:alcohol oxidase [Fomitopsis serialis]|uniref:alcohol oxidase n=1 Tax=Fomitopsis serialis TaxID=139415 RepID=UPI0020086732|nr:alcohol oxidase [Neoantrodia serialis]KAH9921114.1 alcohol oxidase [Neoantrodia serialis]
MTVFPPVEADIIIAGGGTTGCVIAGRLAAADPSLRILILEAGPPTLEDLAHVQPARYLSHLLPGSTTVKFNVGKESADLGGRAPIVPCGQCLGGGSSVNFTMYTRPSPSDYDDWETMYGNEGWSSRELIPLLQKMETYQVAPDKPTHGYDGPLKISYGGVFTSAGKQFLEVAAQYDKSRGTTDDPSDMIGINAYGRWQKYIDKEKGRRSDVPHNYIYNRQLDNLEILTGYHVKRVIFEGERAAGVEFLPNARFRPEEEQAPRVARARKLVVLSSGTFGSPAILERSGVGDRRRLQPLGIDVVVDLPGVGENFQGDVVLEIGTIWYLIGLMGAGSPVRIDHNVIFAPYLVDDDAETLDGIVRNDKEEIERWSAQWLKDGSGLMAHNGIDAGIKLRPSVEDLETIGPEFTEQWQRVFADAPDKPVMWVGTLSMFVGDPSSVPARKYSSLTYFLDYPESVGHVHITSAEDVNAPQDFDPKPSDIALMRWGYKFGREIARRMPSYRGEYVPAHPAFSEGSQAACSGDAKPASIAQANIQYTKEDDGAIDDYTRNVVATAWHNLGTCAMKPREQDGVVDSSLNVYGVLGLKVADMSIAPSNVSSNTYSTAVVIGEKAVTIIMKELGMKRRG